MNRRSATLNLLSVVAALALLPSPANASGTAGNRAAQFVEDRPCNFSAAANLPAERLTCGHLVTAMVHDKPDRGEVRIPVAIIRTQAENPRPDPVVFIAGGPGAAPVTSAHTLELFAGHRFGQDRDVIIYTQRGGLGATPELRCDELRDQRANVYLHDHTLAERDATITAAATQCLHKLQDAGLPATAWSTAENALDLRDLRQALNIESWNLVAVSYGTLIALEAARVDPEGVRALVLDSLVSPESDLFISEAARNFADGMQQVINACAEQADCAQRFPHLDDKLRQVTKRLAESPAQLLIDGPDGPATLSMTVNWHDFLGLVHWMGYNATTLTWVPLLIDETAASRDGLLRDLLSRVFPAPANAADSAAGTFFAVVCRDQYRPALAEASTETTTDPRFGGFAITSFMSAVCADPGLGYGAYPPYQAPTGDTPTLLLSGRFDPMTPRRYAEQVRAGMPHATLGVVNNFGHSTLSGYTACQTDIAAAFLDQPEEAPALDCLAALPPPAFVTGLDQIPGANR